MDKEIIEKALLEISTPTGLTYSGDTTICNDEVKDIMNYIDNLEQQCKKQREVIDKAIELLNNPWSFESGNKEVDEITYNKKRKVIDILNEVSE